MKKKVKDMTDEEWLEMIKNNMHLSEKDKMKLIMGEEIDGLLYRGRDESLGRMDR